LYTKEIDLNINQIQNNIKVTLYKIKFSNSETVIHLAIENNSDKEEFLFLNDTVAVQNRKQFRRQSSNINMKIPIGVIEEGMITLDPLKSYTEDIKLYLNLLSIKFEFDITLDKERNQ
jgi:hypothetical protein